MTLKITGNMQEMQQLDDWLFISLCCQAMKNFNLINSIISGILVTSTVLCTHANLNTFFNFFGPFRVTSAQQLPRRSTFTCPWLRRRCTPWRWLPLPTPESMTSSASSVGSTPAMAANPNSGERVAEWTSVKMAEMHLGNTVIPQMQQSIFVSPIHFTSAIRNDRK